VTNGSPLRILGFGTYNTARHPRVSVILTGLRARGAEVVEANAPLRLSTAERVAMLRRPWRAHRLVRQILSRWWTIARCGRRAARQGRIDAVVVGYLGHFDVLLARLLFPRVRLVLDLLIFAADTARDRRMPAGIRLWLLGLLDATASACADVVLVDTAEHAAMLTARQRRKAVVVPVGAPAEWFAAGSGGTGGGTGTELRVVFFGLFTPLQGTTVIGEALAKLAGRADIHVTMIGTGQDTDVARAAAAANRYVTWLDWVAADRLPHLVADHDVCLGIFGTGPKALRVVPNKVYQGAAAGCAIVTSDTPPQRRTLGDTAVFVPVGDAAALADALRGLADDRLRLAALREASLGRATREFAPQAIVGTLHQLLRTR
jgi:glycosyltransferase involved in cell wall biosynthesis